MARLRFGKYKGHDLINVPTDYLNWLDGQNIYELMDDFVTTTKVAVKAELKRRPFDDEHYYPTGTGGGEPPDAYEMGDPDWRYEDDYWHVF